MFGGRTVEGLLLKLLQCIIGIDFEEIGAGIAILHASSTIESVRSILPTARRAGTLLPWFCSF